MMQGQITQHDTIASIAGSEGSNCLSLQPVKNTMYNQISFYIHMTSIVLFLGHKKRIGLKDDCKRKCSSWMHFRKVNILFEKVS